MCATLPAINIIVIIDIRLVINGHAEAMGACTQLDVSIIKWVAQIEPEPRGSLARGHSSETAPSFASNRVHVPC